MSFTSFSTVCKDITNQQKFVFMDQNLQFLDHNKQMINITKTVCINAILSTFLNNCILFVKTLSGDLNIGCYPHSFAQQEVILQLNQISGHENSSIEFIYQRLSPEEIQKLYPQSSIQQEQKKHKQDSKKSTTAKTFKESQIADDESLSGSSTYCNFKKIKTESLNQNKYFQEDFLADFEADQDLHFQKRKISNTSQITQNLSIQFPEDKLGVSQQINFSNQNKNDQLSSTNQQQNSILNHNLTRSKERSIASAIKIVSQWRDLYEKYKEERVFRDLQEIAEEIGLSKKVLDYYFLELRTAEFFGFDFDSNLEQKFGKIRKFNNSHKQLFIQQNNNKKIPINGNFNYRIINQTPNKASVSCIQKPFKITSIKSSLENNNKYQQQQLQIQNDYCYQNQQYIYHAHQQQQQSQQQQQHQKQQKYQQHYQQQQQYQIYNLPTIHL